MPSQGPNSPGTGADDGSIGTVSWANPGMITADDSSDATASIVTSQVTHYLVASGFGFSIPSTATISGILTTWKYKRGIGGTPIDSTVRMFSGVSLIGSNYATNNPLNITYTYVDYGGAADLWGTTWSPDGTHPVNDPQFGSVISFTAGALDPLTLISVDYCRIAITYTGGPTPDFPPRPYIMYREVHPAQIFE